MIAWRKIRGKQEHKIVETEKKTFKRKKKDLLPSKIASATTIYYIIKWMQKTLWFFVPLFICPSGDMFLLLVVRQREDDDTND